MKDEVLVIAMRLCVRFEGIRLKPYLCPAGVATIGVGSTRYLDGHAVTLKDPPITREVAIQMLRDSIRAEYMPAVLALCPGVDSPGRLAAIVDFTYNLGPRALKTSTLRKKVNAGDWDAVPAEFRKWVRGGGRVLPGLVKRREAEIELL